MAWEIDIKDEAGNVVDSLWVGDFDRLYLLPDGRRCSMPQAIAWCQNCRAFVAAERVPSLASIDETLRALRAGPEANRQALASRGDPLPASFDGPRLEGFVRFLLERWQLIREWRLVRESGERCLRCFSTAIHLLLDGARETVHPITGQRLHIRPSSHAMISHTVFTVEGLPV